MSIPYISQINHELLKPEYITIQENDNKSLNIKITLPFAYKTKQTEIAKYLKTIFSRLTLQIEFDTSIIAHKIKSGLSRQAGIKNIIAVTSGKGGVGKSTTALNLALGLVNNGAQVGLFDADVYGPSVPILVGEREFKPGVSGEHFIPLEKFGIKIMSLGFIVAENQPAIWRGAVVNKALMQMLDETIWGELDYLIVDMPPGTGDIHLTMCQNLPITAVVSVTTPQGLALLDVGKSLAMYKQMEIPCLGIIENMSMHICSNCGHSEAIFGRSGGKILANSYEVDLLAQLPLDVNICKGSDLGLPVAAGKEYGQVYNDLAIKVGQKLSQLGKDYSDKLGKVNVVTRK